MRRRRAFGVKAVLVNKVYRPSIFQGSIAAAYGRRAAREVYRPSIFQARNNEPTTSSSAAQAGRSGSCSSAVTPIGIVALQPDPVGAESGLRRRHRRTPTMPSVSQCTEPPLAFARGSRISEVARMSATSLGLSGPAAVTADSVPSVRAIESQLAHLPGAAPGPGFHLASAMVAWLPDGVVISTGWAASAMVRRVTTISPSTTAAERFSASSSGSFISPMGKAAQQFRLRPATLRSHGPKARSDPTSIRATRPFFTWSSTSSACHRARSSPSGRRCCWRR